jgi:hypothetical protein
MFAKTIYDMGGQKNRLMAYSLTQGNYNWHMMSYQSWGEYHTEMGFRGTFLDYRMMRQIEYRNNLVPNKMGQYYPTKATAEDIEWLMARVCGWESGVDFNININLFSKNPEYSQICDTLQLWEKAKTNNIFSAKQKMFLRQTDRLYHLEEQQNGSLNLKFVKFWQSKNVKITPPSSFKITSDHPATVKPCTAKWFLTHNPALYAECGLSDDLIHNTKNGRTEWLAVFPGTRDPRYSKKQHMLPLLRVAEDAPCGVKNIKIKINGCELVLPLELAPGEYLSIPHDTRLGCIYDSATDDIKREFYLPQFNPYWYLPSNKRGQTNKVEVTCDSLKQDTDTELTLNLRYWKKILPKK